MGTSVEGLWQNTILKVLLQLVLALFFKHELLITEFFGSCSFISEVKIVVSCVQIYKKFYGLGFAKHNKFKNI